MLDGSTEVWPWLALAGASGLIAEWILYGSFRRGRCACGPDAAAPQIRRRCRRCVDDLRSFLGIASGDPADRLGGMGMAIVGAPARACCSRPRRSSLIALALSQPRITVYESKVAVAVLADTSASVSAAGSADRVRTIADKVEGARGRHWTRVIPFARGTRAPAPRRAPKSNWQLHHTAGDAGHGTNLEAAIRDGAAALPAGMVPRLLLISDGNENPGSVARAIWQAQQLGIPIDTVPLAGRPKPGLLLESVAHSGAGVQRRALPDRCRGGAPARGQGDGGDDGRRQDDRQQPAWNSAPGVNHFRAAGQASTTVGAIELAGQDRAPGSGRGALRGRRDAAQPARAAGLARSGRPARST